MVPLDKEEVLYFWTICSAQEQSLLCWAAVTEELVFSPLVLIQRMLELCAPHVSMFSMKLQGV